MNRMIRMALSVGLVAIVAGCATYQAYPGKRRGREGVAVLSVPGPLLRVDGELVAGADARKVELLPGAHVIEWVFVYPNHYRENKSLEFDAVAGRRYRLGQRFFPEPDPAGPIGAVLNLVTDVALAPFEALAPPESPAYPPAGEYTMWITEHPSQRVVAGLAPDVPRGHEAITYVPIEE